MSAFNIEVEGGTSVFLPTAGKYCDRDIVVTATGGSTGGVSKLPQVVNKSVTEITAEDLDGADKISSYAFYACGEMTKIVFPESVKYVYPNAFTSCFKLKELVMNEGLEKIFGSAFTWCTALEEITIPSTVVYIDTFAFSNNEKLKRVIVRATTPPLLESVNFWDATEIIVPRGTREAYVNATNWSELADKIVEGDV